MIKFWLALKFALNIYVVATFITLLVLGVVNGIKRFMQKKTA